MAFFNPSYLWGLLFVVIPIIVHFLFRKKVQRLLFSTSFFFNQTAVKANRGLAWRRIALLIVRALLISTLILIFAKPYNRGSQFAILNNPQISMYCWIDPTISMTYQLNGKTCYEMALSVIDTTSMLLASTVKWYIFDEQLGQFVEKSQWPSRQNQCPRHGTSNFVHAFELFRSLNKEYRKTSILILFSDFQTPLTEQIDSILKQNLFTVPLNLMTVSVASQNAWNYSIRRCGFMMQNASSLLVETFFEGRKAEGAKLQLIIEGLIAGQSLISGEKDTFLRSEIPVALASAARPGFVLLDAEDPFSVDNVYYFTGYDERVFKVLIIGNNESVYPLINVFEVLGKNKWHISQINSPEKVSFEALESADVIIFDQLEHVPNLLYLFFTKRLPITDKVVIFSPSILESAISANKEYFRMLNCNETELKILSHPTMVRLSDTVSVLWQGFPRMLDTSTSIKGYYSGIDGVVLARMQNREPLICGYYDNSRNYWLISATALGKNSFNNIYQTGLYVAFIDRICRYALAQVQREPKKYFAGIAVANPYFASRDNAEVFDENGEFVAHWGTQPFIVFSKPGLYNIRPRNSKSYWIAVNTDTAEIKMSFRLPKFDYQHNFNVASFHYTEFVDYIRTKQSKLSFYFFCGILLILIGCEMALWGWKK